jgi:hypothetical protein
VNCHAPGRATMPNPSPAALRGRAIEDGRHGFSPSQGIEFDGILEFADRVLP